MAASKINNPGDLRFGRALRHKNDASQPERSRHAGERGRRVPGAGAGDNLLPFLACFDHTHRTGPILQRPCGVAPIVFEVEAFSRPTVPGEGIGRLHDVESTLPESPGSNTASLRMGNSSRYRQWENSRRLARLRRFNRLADLRGVVVLNIQLYVPVISTCRAGVGNTRGVHRASRKRHLSPVTNSTIGSPP